MKKTLLTLSILLLLLPNLQAQTWQWGKRGGDAFDNGQPTPYESVIDMATDRNNNVYVLSQLETGYNPDIDNHALTGYGGRDIIITKFSCAGTYMWSKVVGGGGEDIPCAIGTDTLGHVYVCGETVPQAANNLVHFSTDSTQPANNEKTLFLMQLDTLGNFKWLRQPNPDTAAFARNVRCESYDMKVMPNGDLYWLAQLYPGLVSGGNGWAIAAVRPCVLQYNASGTMTGHTVLDMETEQAAFSHMFLQRTAGGKFLVAGCNLIYPGIPLIFKIGGQTVNHSLFVGMFNPQGQLLWKKENTVNINNSQVSGRPLIDSLGYIYLPGTICNLDTFNTYVHVNTLNPAAIVSADPYLCKIDSAGALVWMKVASGLSNNYTAAAAFKSNNEIWLTGDYTSAWWNNTFKVQTLINEKTQLYVTRFNTQGTVLAIDSLKGSFGADNFLRTCVSDKKGNVYIGGTFMGMLYAAGQTMSVKGGYSDMFMARYGWNCNCVAPVANFTQSISTNTISLTYTGTTASVDSVVWNYGNGVTAKKTGSNIPQPFSYTYPQSGTYTICATAYSSCGTDQVCRQISVYKTSISNTEGAAIDIYPNPFTDRITITGMQHSEAILFNALGQQVMKFQLQQQAHTQPVTGLPAGCYLLQLTDPEGNRSTRTLLKQ